MKKIITTICLLSLIATAYGEEKVSVSAGADLVSSYVWLGAAQGQGAAFQPNAAISYAGFTLGAWGSTSLDASGGKEIDFSLSYELKGLTLKVTDYWWAGEAVKYFGTDSHFYEGAITYCFGEKFPLTLSVNTMFAGEGDKDASGEQQYSTWIMASYDFSINDFTVTPKVSFTPWDGMYAGDGQSKCLEAAARISREVKISEKLSLPLFADVIFSPSQEDTYLVFGVSFSL